MTLSPHSNPYGYKKLLVYEKAEELQRVCAAFTQEMMQKGERGETGEKGNLKTLRALQDQMDRSARSVKQNIVEGWKRNSTKEYHQFLGFSLGANAELEEDCNDIIKGVYERGEKGIMGWEKWAEREKGGEKRGKAADPLAWRQVPGDSLQKGTPSSHLTSLSRLTHSPHLTPLSPLTLDEVERLPFYPLNSRLPHVIQLKLRCKELNMLLSKLQKSLLQKMTKENMLPQSAKIQLKRCKEEQDDLWLAEEVKRAKGEQRE